MKQCSLCDEQIAVDEKGAYMHKCIDGVLYVSKAMWERLTLPAESNQWWVDEAAELTQDDWDKLANFRVSK